MHGEFPKQILAKARGGTRRTLAIGIVLIALAAALYYVFSASAPQQRRGGRFAAGEGPVPVLVAPAARADVPVYLDAVGTIKALNTVTVRPQVDGKLLSVNFKEGDDVKKADVLAKIDPIIYQAQLNQRSPKAQDARSRKLKIDLERYERLPPPPRSTNSKLISACAVAQYTALVEADQAAIDNAQRCWATRQLPIDAAPAPHGDGTMRPGRRQFINCGHHSCSRSRCCSICCNRIFPSEHRFGRGLLNAGAARITTVIDCGASVTTIRSKTTGTVKPKAEFPNANLQLWPGQFVNIRLLVDTLKQVVVIPTGAVQRGPNGTFVYVVKDDDTVSVRPITVQKQDEMQTVISKGLEAPERVVTTGFVRLTDGTKVAVGSGEAPAAQPAGQRPQGQGGARRQRGGGTARPNTQQ
jgi:multidrug efflux system membrane fusion protein